MFDYVGIYNLCLRVSVPVVFALIKIAFLGIYKLCLHVSVPAGAFFVKMFNDVGIYNLCLRVRLPAVSSILFLKSLLST